MVIIGLVAVLFFFGLAITERFGEYFVDVDFKPYFIPLLFTALLPPGKSGKITWAVALGAAVGEAIGDLIEGYEIDEQITERTVAEEVGFPLQQARYERTGLFSQRERYGDSDIRERAARACSTVGLPEELLDHDPTMLAHGERKLVTIAETLVLDPPVLVLDEPAAGLDVNARRHLNRVITEVHRRGTAVMLIDHDMLPVS